MESSPAHIDQMIFAAVQACAPDVAERCRQNMQATAPFSVPPKPVVLKALLAARGPQAVLELAAHFPKNAMGSPMLFLLLNSSSPITLINKLTRYDRYFHPHRSIALCEAGQNFLEAENQCNGALASAEDELFLCGVLRVLLAMIGCQGLQIEWKTVSSRRLQLLLEQLNIPVGQEAKTTRWYLHWKYFQRSTEIPGLNEFFQGIIQRSFGYGGERVTRAVRTALLHDLAQRPNVEQIAAQLGMSVRSLQRALSQEGTTFISVFQKLRIETAENLLREYDLTFADISYLSGFSDTSHFTREFKKSFKMTPADYQRMLVVGGKLPA